MKMYGSTAKSLVFTCSHARLATHYIPSSRLQDLKTSLASGSQSAEAINNILESFSGDYSEYSLAPCAEVIEKCFGKYEVPEIMKALKQVSSGADAGLAAWANEVLSDLSKMSPMALFTTLEMLKRAKRLSFASCLKMEYILSHEFSVYKFQICNI